MRSQPTFLSKKQSGFTFVEIMIGLAILAIVLPLVISIITDFSHSVKMAVNAHKFSEVPIAVQRRAAHDGFLFDPWDTNGGDAAGETEIIWDEDNFNILLTDFLVGRNNVSCGNDTDGWNPFNNAGGPDLGAELNMERAALVGCNSLRGTLPYNIRLSAAIEQDAGSSQLGLFRLYLNMENANFGVKNNPDNNILNFVRLRSELVSALKDNKNGIPRVHFGLTNDVTLIDDDTIWDDDGNSVDPCEDRLRNGQRCDIIITIDYAGVAVGLHKRIDNQDFHTDDVTFGTNAADLNSRQRCAYWEEDGAGVWAANEVDCAIKAGAGDAQVKLVVDEVQATDFRVSTVDAAGAALTHLCDIFNYNDATGNPDAAIAPELTNVGININAVATNEQTPCGFDSNGGVVQILTDDAFVGDRLYARNVVSDRLFASQTTLFSTTAGDIVLEVMDAANNTQTFSITNEGNMTTLGGINVALDSEFGQAVSIGTDLTVVNNATFNMDGNGRVTLGVDPNDALVMERDASGNFNLRQTGGDLEIVHGGLNSDQGILIGPDADNDVTVTMNANGGVIASNNTTIHGSKSTLSGELFDATNGITTDELKAHSEFVTADMAKYLDDTSSDIQIVGVERIEGEFVTLTKPNCLAFAEDDVFSSAAANPYGNLAATTQGEDLARLVLIPMYMKTYNSAFGDNQIFAQHASHASDTAWDIYLYLSGEGAFGTGAREDGAGGSLAMILCDYSDLDISRLTF